MRNAREPFIMGLFVTLKTYPLFLMFILPMLLTTCCLAKYSGGTGEANDPYLIATPNDIDSIGLDPCDWDKHFKMTADINWLDFDGKAAKEIGDYNPSQPWTGTPFSGVFDGEGHQISNWCDSSSNSYGISLFGRIEGPNAIVKNITFIGPLTNRAVLVEYLKGTVGNCRVEDGNVLAEGGLVGDNYGLIQNSYSRVNIEGGQPGALARSNWDGGTIRNCSAAGKVTGDSCVGGLVGWSDGLIEDCCAVCAVDGNDAVGGLVGMNKGNISNCSSAGTVCGGSDSHNLGGLVGINDSPMPGGGSIINCFSTSDVNGGNYLGGLAGGNNHSVIRDSYSTGIVAGGDNSEIVGGLVGVNGGSGDINNCFSTGNVTGRWNLGGLVGHNTYGSNITNCYSTGNVTGPDSSHRLGGLVGLNDNSSISKSFSTGSVTGGVESSSLGGLVGSNSNSSISDCYSTASVTGDSLSGYLGGLAGYNSSNSDINNCYSAGTVVGAEAPWGGGLVGGNWGNISSSYFLDVAGPNNGNGTPLTDEQMKQQSSFTSWDFVDIWQMCTCGAGYPRLKWQCEVLFYSGGSGTAAEPYRIATVCDWQELMSEPNDWNKHFIMTADVNLQDILLTPVGNDTNHFTGVFDGGGHIIFKAEVNGFANNHAGLFGDVNCCEIKNLGLENVRVTSISGIVLGYAGGLVGKNMGGSISNCFATGVVFGEQPAHHLGGLIGANFYGTVSDCCAMVDVNGGVGAEYLGGLVGMNLNGSSISNCLATGDVNGGGMLGGLVGRNFGNISNCSAAGSVGGNWNLGGLVGEADTYNNNISNCRSSGSVAGHSSLGGLVGQINGGSISGCFSTAAITGRDGSLGLGGLVGMIMDDAVNINNCYSIGNVTGGNNSDFVGGLVGKNRGSPISNCYSTGDVNGTSNVGGLIGAGVHIINNSYFLDVAGPNNGIGTPLTDEQMKQQASFVGWDFNTPIWKICQGTNYPKLAWQIPLPGDFVCPDGVDIYDLAIFAEQWLLEKLSADIKQDGIVNFLDYAIFGNNWQGDMNSLSDFSSQWLKSSAYCADIAPAPGGNGVVNMQDFALFAVHWFEEN